MNEWIVACYDDGEELVRGQIVRCKDCKYWNGETKGCVRNPCVKPWRKYDFCSYGEKVTE